MIKASVWLGHRDTTHKIDLHDHDFLIEFVSESGESVKLSLEDKGGLKLRVYTNDPEDLIIDAYVKEMITDMHPKGK